MRATILLVLATLGCACSTGIESTDASAKLAIVIDEQRPTYSSVRYDAAGFVVDGRYRILRGGSVQWFRLPEQAWDDRLARFRAAGFNTVDVYVPWNVIEPAEGEFELESPNLRKFLDLCKAHGLYVYLRPGPYITNEMDGGGVPAWVLERTTKKDKAHDGRPNLRTDDPDYLELVARYFDALNNVVRPYLITHGGPIVLYSIENEYDWFEIFSEVDKLFWYDGGPERGLLQTPGTANYLAALRDLARGDGIDVPITTCPGGAKIAGTGDVPGVIPMPNIYVNTAAEKVANDILTDMHDPSRHGGVYVDMPSGSTETERTAARLERLVMGGLDAFFAFNVVGMQTDGYRNALVMRAGGLSSVFEVSPDKVLDAFVSPTVGYFPNVIDYYGAISPSGVLRAKFWSFRRTNLMLDAFETSIASVRHPRRSGRGLPAGDPRLEIMHPSLGALEDGVRVFSWLDAGAGSAFVGLTNETGVDQVLAPGSVTIDGRTLPRLAPMTVPAEDYPGPAGGAESENVHILVVGAQLGLDARLGYTTSEVLTLRDYGNDRLLMVHGVEGSDGELLLDELGGAATIVHRDAGIAVAEADEGHVLLGYRHVGVQQLVVRTAQGRTLRIVITTRELAGRTWFFRADETPLVVIGPDLARPSPSGGLALEIESRASDDHVLTLSPRPFTLDGFTPEAAWDESTGVAWHHRAGTPLPSTFPDVLNSGLRPPDDDITEAAPAQASGDGWVRWSGDPMPLERLGINAGHAWYRAHVQIDSDPASRPDGWGLWLDHASDFVGLYVNGHYVTTLAPLGTEIDSRSWSPSYAFPDITPYLRRGDNVIAFRVEMWGHGSFMWPRGTLIPTKMQLPSLGFDAVKGLWGKAEIGGQRLSRWEVRAGLGGERAGWASVDAETRDWSPSGRPTTLARGAVSWYRVRLPADAVPDPAHSHTPAALRLRGSNAKATLWVNGRLIGRWLSDEMWLRRGCWARGSRDAFVPGFPPLPTHTSPDDFPLDVSTLRRDGTDVVAIAFEDVSGAGGMPGHIDELRIVAAEEERAVGSGNQLRLIPMPVRRATVTLHAN